VFVALNLVGIILIKIVIVIIVRREYVSHVIAQCPGRVASTAGAFLLSHQQNQGYLLTPQKLWPLSRLYIRCTHPNGFLSKNLSVLCYFPRNI